jgi:hypothetical protein
MKTKGFLLTLALVAFIGVVDAQNQSKTQKQTNKETATNTQRGKAFVDNNNNGICDNFEYGTPRNPAANGTQRLLDGSGRKNGNATGQRNGQGFRRNNAQRTNR